jgi:Uma2 family endonuclease
VHATPSGKHFGVVARLRRQIEARLPGALTVAEGSSVRAADSPDDHATPDLMVLPREWEESDEWLAAPATVALVVEVVPAQPHSELTGRMPHWYAAARIPLFLLVDPRNGTWDLFSRPGGPRYASETRGRFGDAVDLPAPFAFPLDTARLPRYADEAVTG